MSCHTILSKIYIVEGDCSEKDLNLNVNDRELIVENVSMIF